MPPPTSPDITTAPPVPTDALGRPLPGGATADNSATRGEHRHHGQHHPSRPAPSAARRPPPGGIIADTPTTTPDPPRRTPVHPGLR
ncbi:hypothetical protein [Streptomyces xylophagus]|uniref:hypothetical protein n=1 Tax=Streptomyces xylophagus TaxID=285514 RepID=UPI000A92D023|nr:hypothetical protein [Streptomyces xylophagus]